MQRDLNNAIIETDRNSNQIYYKLTSCINTELNTTFSTKLSTSSIKKFVQDNIVFSQTLFKQLDVKRHINFQFQIHN